MYDSTNVVPKPIVTGVTALGLDHTLVLGKTLGEIGWQKGGIYKVPLFVHQSFIHSTNREPVEARRASVYRSTARGRLSVLRTTSQGSSSRRLSVAQLLDALLSTIPLRRPFSQFSLLFLNYLRISLVCHMVIH